MSMIKIGMIGIAAVFLALLLKKEKETKEKRDCLRDMHFKSVYQKIS